jgi:hypothetical protein
MKTTLGAFALGAIWLVLGVEAGGETTPAAAPAKEQAMIKATGTFEVKLTPQPVAEGLGRMTIDKTFQGDLEGSSVGEMLSAMGGVKGSAGYVAIEKVTGKLGGKSGTFVLQHSGSMDRGAPSLTVTVVPDSGTGELVGLSGKLGIRIEGGQHFYDFEYSLDRPAPPEKKP